MMKSPLVVSVSFGANAAIADATLFVCPEGAEFEVVEVMESHVAAGNDGGAVALDVVKCDSGVAIAAGATVLGTTFDLKSIANTTVRKSTASGLAAALATRTVKSGQRLDLDFQGTLTTLTGVGVTITLRERRPAVRR